MRRLLVGLLFFIGLDTQAADSAVLRFVYQANQVYHLYLSPLAVTSIHFQGAKQIQSMHCGDATAWDIHPSPVVDNSLLLKPIKLGSKTDLIVQVDNKPVLFRIESGRHLAENPLLLVNMQFLRHKRKRKQPVTTHYHAYCFKGSPSLKPQWMFDNGEYSYLAWSRNVAMPAIYRLADNGKQMYLTNFRIHKRVFLLPRLSRYWLLRRGKEQAVLSRMRYHRGRRVCDG
jgi:type IV secretory pathway VirB9-like protein